MSANDKFYGNWFTNSGRPNIIDRIGQVYKPNSIQYSNTYILGSNVNGLCEFEALNEAFTPLEAGQIQKLQVASKVQNEQGSIMLAVCQAQAASIYIGEVQLLGSSGNAFVAQSAGVIGTINVLKGNYGTINPESVVEYRGNVYWIDANNGKVIQYSGNGLFPISQYRMTRFWKQFCDQYVRMTPQEIEAFGSRPFIFMTVDPHHNELLITIPQLLSTPPNGYLPDYPLSINPFYMWDGQAKTIVFKIGVGVGNPYWVGAYQFTPEWYMTLQNELYSSKNGILWQHNQRNYCEFYGTQYKPSLSLVSNMAPSNVKVYNAISILEISPQVLALFSAIAPCVCTLLPYLRKSSLNTFCSSEIWPCSASSQLPIRLSWSCASDTAKFSYPLCACPCDAEIKDNAAAESGALFIILSDVLPCSPAILADACAAPGILASLIAVA